LIILLLWEKKFDPYSTLIWTTHLVQSFLSKEDVYTSASHYKKNAKFISNDEVEKFEESISKPFDMNKIKDIDSVFEEANERFAYCGNKHLGKSDFIANSDTIFDSNFVFNSTEVVSCEYVAHCHSVREGKYLFGATWTAKSEFLMKSMGVYESSRIFEGHFVFNSSDILFSFQLRGCSECMFTFNKKNMKYAIGNTQLTKEKYYSIKKKLLSEIAEELRRKKTFPGLFELVGVAND